MRYVQCLVLVLGVCTALAAEAAGAAGATGVVAMPSTKPPRLSNVDDLTRPLPGPPGRDEPSAPFSLTSSDGSGIVLRRVEARVVVDGPLAWTELWLTFHNPEPRVREGRFTVTLPPDGALGRFAMKIGAHWMDGEVVEKHQAEVAYDDFLHARQDPAILTKDLGNQFSARVFPIAASADKELVLAWSQPLADPSVPYVLPLAGLPRMAELSLHAWSLQDGVPRVLVDAERKNDQPLQDLQLWPAGTGNDVGAIRSGDRAIVRVRLTSAETSAAMPSLAILFDTSASAALDFERRLAQLQEIVAFAGKQGATNLLVTAFDQEQQEVFSGPPDQFGAAPLRMLRERGALGASNLSAALQHLGARIKKNPAKWRVLLMSDCMATAGAVETAALQVAVRALSDSGVNRLDVVLPEGARNQDLATALVASALPSPGTVVRGPVADLARLGRAVLPPVDVTVTGAAWSWPTQVTGLQPGDAFLVVAQMDPKASVAVRLSGGASGEVKPEFRAGSSVLVERAAAAAQVARLEAQLAVANQPETARIRAELVALSVGHRLLSSQTAFLVLESERDYARYQIDRDKPVPLLAITAAGQVQAVGRGDPALALKAVDSARPVPQREVQYRQGAGDGSVAQTQGDDQGEPLAAPPSRSTRTDGRTRDAISRSSTAGSLSRAGASTKLFAEDPGEGGSVVGKFGSGDSGRGGSTIEHVRGGGQSFRSRPADTVSTAPAKSEPTVKVNLGAMDGCDGGDGSREGIAKKISARSGAIQACYEAALRDNPDLGGKVKVKFTVGTAGTVTDVTVSGAEGAFKDCIEGKFKSVRGLPILAAPQEFSQSFVFQRNGPPPKPETPAERAARKENEARTAHRDQVQRNVESQVWLREHRAPTAEEKAELARLRWEEAQQRREEARWRREEAKRERLDRAWERREEAAERREAARAEREERRRMAFQLGDLKLVYDHREAIGQCLSNSRPRIDRAAIEVSIAATGVMGARMLQAASKDTQACLHKALQSARGKASPGDDRVFRLLLLFDGATWQTYPTPEGVARGMNGTVAMDARSGGCRLGPTWQEMSAKQEATFALALSQLPDAAAFRYAKLRDATATAADGGQAAWRWHLEQPAEILPLVAYGEALRRSDPRRAARAFGSLIDLHPARADMRRFAANLLESTGEPGLDVALDSYAAAQRLRPDHPSGYPQRALAMARAHQFAAALDLLEESLTTERRSDAARMSSALARDAFGLVAAAWMAKEPDQKSTIEKRLSAVRAVLPTGPGLRFLLTWETDANDVDFHVGDAHGNKSCFSARELRTGGRLFEDVTTGYGPEWFAIDGPKAFPYTINAHYYRRGPMGFGMGRVLIVRWDGRAMTFEDRPFVVTMDDESARLGVVGR